MLLNSSAYLEAKQHLRGKNHPWIKRGGELTLLDGAAGCGDVTVKKNDAPRLPSQSQLFQMPNCIWIFQHRELSECVLSAGMVIGVWVCNRPCMDSFVYWWTGGHICISFACHFTVKKRLSPWSLQWSGLCRISCSFPCHLNLKKRKICTNVTEGGLPVGGVEWAKDSHSQGFLYTFRSLLKALDAYLVSHCRMGHGWTWCRRSYCSNSMYLGMWTWWRRLAESSKWASELRTKGDLCEFEYRCWCQTCWSECFTNCWFLGFSLIAISRVLRRMFPEKEVSGSCGEENALLRSVLTVVTSSFWAPLVRTEHFKALCWVARFCWKKKRTVPGSNEIKLIFVSSTSEYHYGVQRKISACSVSVTVLLLFRNHQTFSIWI